MPKQSRKFDISRSMVGGKPVKRAKTDKKATNTEIDIKSAGETPEDLKKTIVAQLIKEGKVRRTRSYDFSKLDVEIWKVMFVNIWIKFYCK